MDSPHAPAVHPSLSRALVRQIREKGTTPGDLDAAVSFVQDWMGAYVAGWPTAPAAPLMGYAGGRSDLEGRVFLAAALSHIAETDDLHRRSVTHPGCVVVPVALLLGRERGKGGAQVLRAVLAGYEAMIRVGNALGPSHYRIFHNTATAGVFGAAAAAANLLELDEDGWVWALGNAGTQAGGLWEFLTDAAMSKHLHAGMAATAGLRAALLAAHGFTGPERILEGERGFFRGFCPDPDPSLVLEPDPGWALPGTSIKPWPCCRHTHPAIAAALAMRESGVGEGEFVLSTYGTALRVTDDPEARTPYAARFSLQFCVAAALARGSIVPDTFEGGLHSPDIRSLMPRVRVQESPELEGAYPRRWGAVLRWTGAGGEHREVAFPDAPGDPECPLTPSQLEGKVLSLFRHGGLPDAAGAELFAACGGMAVDGEVPVLPWPGGAGVGGH
jgi:2-methylcitrate dehydratase PrpD